ncbi:MAG: class C sortase [Collinsella sp.]|nr:class C sortase [Collinsella sp.]
MLPSQVRSPLPAYDRGQRFSAPQRPPASDGGGSRRRPRITTLLAVLAILVGMGMLVYPLASNLLLEASQGQVLSYHQEAVSQKSEADLEAERERARAYNADLVESRTLITDPFLGDRPSVDRDRYEGVLNVSGDGVMGMISIPKIGVEQPIYHGVSDDVLQKGVGHLEGTSVPMGGESTHSVLTGHTGLPSGEIFDKLDKVEVGDFFILSVLGEDLAYRVTDIEVVLPERTESLIVQPERDLVTLVTCTPYGVNSHRLLVHAERCDIPREWIEADEGTGLDRSLDRKSGAISRFVLLALLLLGAIASVAAFMVWLRRRTDRRRGAACGAPRSVPGSHFGHGRSDVRGGSGSGRPLGKGGAHAAHRRDSSRGGDGR